MMEEMNEVHDFMSKFSGDVETKWGLYKDEELGSKVKFTILATGFGINNVPGMDTVLSKRSLEEQQRLAAEEEEEQQRDKRRTDYYGKDGMRNSKKKKRHNIYVFSMEDLDNDDIISAVEATPTFQRSKTVLESIQSKANTETREVSQPASTSPSDSSTITF